MTSEYDRVNRLLNGRQALEATHDVFRHWLGDTYDLDVLDIVLATAVVEQLDGDPLWTLVISGSGNAKTETVQALAGIGAHVTSTIASEAALLSGTPARDKAKDATGGLLRKIGDHGILVIKDVTSILSMGRELRGSTLAAFREIYDGHWERNMGTDGGRSLNWRGRIAVIGAVTTAWDQAHDVIATMGDRFVLARMNSNTGRLQARQRAIRNTGHENQMRTELAQAIKDALTDITPETITLTDQEIDRIGAAADLVTLARTAVIYDYRGDVVDAHAPEMPTRFAKQLTQIMRGAVVLGADRTRALNLAIRAARDSMNPLRLSILDDINTNPQSSPSDIRRRLEKPWTTVDRQCKALHMLGLLTCDEVEYGNAGKSRWLYSVSDQVDCKGLESSPVLSVETPSPSEEIHALIPPTDLTGETPAQVSPPTQDPICIDCRAPLDSLWHAQRCLGD